MLFPVQQLIEGRGAPLCVAKDTKITDALARMVQHDYSQLPVVDEYGKLSGIISENSIIGTYYHIGGSVSLLDLTADHCQRRAETLSPESDIFEALDKLDDVYAIVIVKDQRPVGILTDYDTTHFFRDLSEGLILVEDIEVTLRQYIEAAFPTEKARTAALMHAFRPDRKDPTRPAYEYEELTLGQHIQLITTEENWLRFEEVLGPKDLFAGLMSNVRDIRNQLAHFRGRVEPIQHHALIAARDWLAARPRLRPVTDLARQATRVVAVMSPPGQGGERYQRLQDWLQAQRGRVRQIRVSVDDIERLLGDSLPSTARQHRSWWDNDPNSGAQCLAWMRAGWQVEDVDLAAGEVLFKQTKYVLMQLFFVDLLAGLKQARPGITRATRTSPTNWWSFGAGKSGIGFIWSFTSLPALHVELYIDTGDKARNKALYDQLVQHQDEIGRQLGIPVRWERLPNKQASRIVAERPGTTINDPPEGLEEAKQWALDTMLRFVDALQPRVKQL